MSNFWDLLWLMFSAFMFVAYLFVMFQVVVDLFRDSTLGGGSRVLWIIGLIVLPFLTALLYILTRGRGMTEAPARPTEIYRPRPTSEPQSNPDTNSRPRMERELEPAAAALRPEQDVQGFAPRIIDTENLDIPTFLRNRSRGG